MSDLLTWINDPQRQREIRAEEDARAAKEAESSRQEMADSGERFDEQLRGMVADSVDRLDTRPLMGQSDWDNHLAGTFARSEQAAFAKRLEREAAEVAGEESPRGDSSDEEAPRYDGPAGDERAFAAWQRSLFGKTWGTK